MFRTKKRRWLLLGPRGWFLTSIDRIARPRLFCELAGCLVGGLLPRWRERLDAAVVPVHPPFQYIILVTLRRPILFVLTLTCPAASLK